MGYADRLRGTVKVDLGEGYTVTVKKALTRAELAVCEAVLSSKRTLMRTNKEGEVNAMERSMDTSAYREKMIEVAIVEWNIDGECGVKGCVGLHTVWPVDNGHISALAAPDFQTLFRVIEAANKGRTKEEKADFRPEGELGSDDGDTNE